MPSTALRSSTASCWFSSLCTVIWPFARCAKAGPRLLGAALPRYCFLSWHARSARNADPFQSRFKRPATDKAQARRLLNSADCYKSRFGVDPPTDVWGKNEEASSESEDEDEETTAVDQDSESPQHAVDVVHRAGGEPFLIVFVQIETGKIIEVRLTQDVSVGYLKGTIQDLEGLPADQQRLIFTGKQLEDGRYLMSDYGVRTRNVLYLVMRLRGRWASSAMLSGCHCGLSMGRP